MTVRKILISDELLEISGEGYEPRGEFQPHSKRNKQTLELGLKIAALCNNSILKKNNIIIKGLFRKEENPANIR